MLDLSQIVPNVSVGLCLTSTDEIDDLTAIPITAVLNLQTDDDFDLENIDWPRLAEHYRQVRVEVVPNDEQRSIEDHLPAFLFISPCPRDTGRSRSCRRR